jgi:flagellar basal body-associated protein FliL
MRYIEMNVQLIDGSSRRKGNSSLVIILIAGFIILLLLSGVLTGLVTKGSESSYNRQIPKKISKLPSIELENVQTYEHYKHFADNTNNLIYILNEQQEWFEIPTLGTTVENWNKISKVLTEYGPLIGNYNDVIFSAKKFEESGSNESLEEFYISSSHFAFESLMIWGTVFYKTSYKTVGVIYRASGLNRLALSCPSCVRIALSSSHWAIRNSLVETSSLVANKIIELKQDSFEKVTLDSLQETGKGLLDTGVELIEKGKNKFVRWVNGIQKD